MTLPSGSRTKSAAGRVPDRVRMPRARLRGCEILDLQRNVRDARMRQASIKMLVADRSAVVRHFAEHGWVVVDAVPEAARGRLAAWVDEIAALPDSTGPDSTGVLQHREARHLATSFHRYCLNHPRA
jgi:hypothetical protein